MCWRATLLALTRPMALLSTMDASGRVPAGSGNVVYSLEVRAGGAMWASLLPAMPVVAMHLHPTFSGRALLIDSGCPVTVGACCGRLSRPCSQKWSAQVAKVGPIRHASAINLPGAGAGGWAAGEKSIATAFPISFISNLDRESAKEDEEEEVLYLSQSGVPPDGPSALLLNGGNRGLREVTGATTLQRVSPLKVLPYLVPGGGGKGADPNPLRRPSHLHIQPCPCVLGVAHEPRVDAGVGSGGRWVGGCWAGWPSAGCGS